MLCFSLRDINLNYIRSTGLSRFVTNKLSVVQDGFEIVIDFNVTYNGLIFEVGSYSVVGTYGESEDIVGSGAIE